MCPQFCILKNETRKKSYYLNTEGVKFPVQWDPKSMKEDDF